jgi:uncharacterized membrane protein
MNGLILVAQTIRGGNIMPTPATAEPGAGEKPGVERLIPVDLLRGLIMVFMALDHANYFIAQQHSSGEY